MDPATIMMLAQLLQMGLKMGGVTGNGDGGGGGFGGMGGGGMSGMSMLSGLFGGGGKKKPKFQGFVPPQGQGGGDPMMAALVKAMMLQKMGGQMPGMDFNQGGF